MHSPPWIALPTRQGGTPAVSGGRLAAAARAQLTVCLDAQAAATYRSPVPAPGAIAWLPQGLCWGPGRMAGDALPWQALPALVALAPSPQWTPLHWAWRADGQALLLIREPVAAGGRAQAVRANAAGAVLASWPLVDAGDAPALLGADHCVIGHRQAAVHAADGRLLARLANPAPALRLAFCGGDTRVLLVEPGRISLHDLPGAAQQAEWTGHWIDACATPDGRWLLAVDVQGRLARLDAAVPAAAPEWWELPDPVQAVACDGATVLASFRSGPALRRRAWAP